VVLIEGFEAYDRESIPLAFKRRMMTPLYDGVLMDLLSIKKDASISNKVKVKDESETCRVARLGSPVSKLL
jgi:hypothetical protein